MSNKHGDFIWYELLSSDADGAQKFYGGILGWQVRDSGQKDMDYRLLEAKDPDTGAVHQVGGLMQISEQMKAGGARPVWLGYIGVDDVDLAVMESSRAAAPFSCRPSIFRVWAASPWSRIRKVHPSTS